MSTSANPQGLLRRPKKPDQSPSGGPPIIAIAAAVVVLGGGVAGAYAFFGHPHATQSSTAAAPGDQYAMVSHALTVPVHLFAGSAKHKTTHAAVAPKPTSGASPAATPTAAPSATPLTTASSPAASAHARHLAALHLAALRRAQAAAAQQQAQSLQPSNTTLASASQAQPVVSTPPPTDAATPQPTATPDAAPTPVYAPRIVVDARFVNRVAPDYPNIARDQGAGGTAIVLATVGPSGTVLSVAIDQSTGNKLLDSSALAAARESTFEAPEIDGAPATETYRIVYTFDPNQ